MNKINLIFGVMCIILLVTEIFFIISVPKVQKIEIVSSFNFSEEEIINSCNLSIEKASKCIIEKIKPYFVYNETDDRIKLTFNQLMARGGDCKDWSELYVRIGNELGFYSKIVTMKVNDKTNHAVAMFSNDKSYCILSQKDYSCWSFTSINKINSQW